jgi:hypothetical protein
MNDFDPVPCNEDSGGCGVGILSTCRQAYTEAMPLLYSRCSFEFGADPGYGSSVRSTLHFFAKVIPKAAYKHVRYLSFQIQERIESDGGTTVLSTTPAGGEGKGDGEYLIRLFTLFKASQLRHLNLSVVNQTKYSHSPRNNSIDLGSEPYRGVSDWVTPILTIKNLDRLTLRWSYTDVTCLGRALAAAKLMRSSMLKNGNIWKAQDGIRVCLRHKKDCGYRGQDRRLVFDMDIDARGNSHLDHVRRVKFIPDGWCSSCGSFAASGKVGYKDCACGALKKSYRGHKGLWTGNDWDGKPLQNFLPEDVTDDDYYQANAFADAGFQLQFHGVCWYETGREDYTDSDFGDNDSLNSVHGWSDNEETD